MKDKINIGDIIECEVTGIKDYGIFVIISNNYTGLIHKSEISNSYVVNPSDYVTMHETIRAEVLNVNEEKKQMILSVKNIRFHIEDEEKYQMHETEHGFNTLKDSLDIWIKEKTDEIKNRSS